MPSLMVITDTPSSQAFGQMGAVNLIDGGLGQRDGNAGFTGLLRVVGVFD